MAYAFCVRLDADSEAAVAALWSALAGGGADHDMLRLGYAPHLSLAVLDEEPPRVVVDAAMAALADEVGFGVQLGGARQFAGTPIVWLAVAGAGLSRLHQRLLGQLPVDQVREHYRAGAWVPHVTLQMTGDAERALAIARERWPVERAARVVMLELVQFSPIVVLQCQPLAVGDTSGQQPLPSPLGPDPRPLSTRHR